MFSRGILFQFACYLVVGGLSFAADLACFLPLLGIGVPVLSASAISFSVGAVVNYFLSRGLAFRAGRHRMPKEMSIFLFVVLVGLGLTTVLMYLLTSRIHLSPLTAKLIIVPIVLAWSFLGRRHLVFHPEVPSTSLSISRFVTSTSEASLTSKNCDP